MALSRTQVEIFCGELAELFSVRIPRVSHRRQVRCRFKQKTLHLGRAWDRAGLAHQLAHFFHGEFLMHDFLNDGRRRRPRVHGREFRAWERLIGNYIAQEFGEGEGVML